MVDSHIPRNRLRRWAGRAGGASLLIGSLLLAGCLPSAQPTLPVATRVVSQPVVATTVAPLPPALPSAQATRAGVTAPVVSPSAPSGATSPQRKSVTLTILHTNDVRGETDPCG